MSPDVLLECPRTSFRDVLRVNVTERVWISPGQKSVWRSLLCFVQVQARRPSLCPFWNQLKEQLWVGQGEFFVRMFYVPLFVRIINVEYMSA